MQEKIQHRVCLVTSGIKMKIINTMIRLEIMVKILIVETEKEYDDNCSKYYN